MKLKNILKNNATLIITIFLALTIAILSAKFMLSSNEDYLSIINNLIEEQNYDDALNYQSIKKLTNYDIKKVVCYHGGIYEDNVNSCIRELAGR